MITKIIILFLLLSILQFIKVDNKFNKLLLFSIFSIILFYLAAFRGSDVDRDYNGYIKAYEGDDLLSNIYEPTFTFISYIIKTYLNNNTIYLFVIYAFFGVVLKMFSINKISKFIFVSLLLYVSYYFSLHELTQIRVGVACTFLLLSIPSLYDRNPIVYFSIISVAFLFHFSAIIFFPLWFLNSKKIKKSSWFLLIILSILFGIFFKNFISTVFQNYSFGFFEQKVLSYSIENNSRYNIFNIWILFKIFISSLILYNIDLINDSNKYSIILVKIYFLSISFFYIFSFNPTFSGRFSDLLGITEIVLFPTLIHIFKPKYYAKLFILLFSISLLFLNLFYNKIIL